MDKNVAIQLAKSLMLRHGLNNWTFALSSHKKRLAECQVPFQQYDGRIRVSADYVEQNSLEDVQDTILHEIAHALVGPHRQHDEVWKVKCVEIGCNPERLKIDFVKVPGKYQVVCPRCGTRTHFYRKPAHAHYSCVACGPSVILEWDNPT